MRQGNAAGDEATIALPDREKRIEAETIARQVECLELIFEREVSLDKHP